MTDVAKLGLRIQKKFSEYEGYDPENVGMVVLATTRLMDSDYRDYDIAVLASAVLSRIYNDASFFGTLVQQFSWYNRKKNQDIIYQEIESIKRLMIQRYEFEKQSSDQSYEKKTRPERREQARRVEEALTEAKIERARQLIPEEYAGQVALAKTVEEAAARKIMVTKEAETRSILVIEREKAEIEKKMLEVRRNDQILKDQAALEHKEKMDKLELARREQEISQDISASTIFALQNLANADQIQLSLRKRYERIDQLKHDTSYAARKERKLLKNSIKELEQLYYATTRLFQGETREDPTGSHEDTEGERDPR